MIIGTGELSRRSGATHNQIKYWCEQGIIEAAYGNSPGVGFPRQFDDDIVKQVKLLVIVSKKCHFNKEILQQIYKNYADGSLFIGDGLILDWDFVVMEER